MWMIERSLNFYLVTQFSLFLIKTSAQIVAKHLPRSWQIFEIPGISMKDVLHNPTEAKTNGIIGIVEWGTTHADLIDAMHHMPTEKWLAYQQQMNKKLGHSRSLVATTPFILYIKQVTLQQQKQQSVGLARILLDRDAAALHRTLKTNSRGRPPLSALIAPDGEVKHNMAMLLYAACLIKYIIPLSQ